MKVYILWQCFPCESPYLIGIYATFEKAKERKFRIEQRTADLVYTYKIVEEEVQE